MFKKVRKDMDEEKKEENEANYQKRVTQVEQKDAKKDVGGGGGNDWFNDLKTVGTN